MTYPRADRSPEALAFAALLNDALQGHPRVHLPPYRVPTPIVYTPEQTESQMRAANRFWDEF
jgi:hypothetical protein